MTWPTAFALAVFFITDAILFYRLMRDDKEE